MALQIALSQAELLICVGEQFARFRNDFPTAGAYVVYRDNAAPDDALDAGMFCQVLPERCEYV
jgi:hypothetical protein